MRGEAVLGARVLLGGWLLEGLLHSRAYFLEDMQHVLAFDRELSNPRAATIGRDCHRGGLNRCTCGFDPALDLSGIVFLGVRVPSHAFRSDVQFLQLLQFHETHEVIVAGDTVLNDICSRLQCHVSNLRRLGKRDFTLLAGL